MELEGSEPGATPQSGELERAIYAPPVYVEVEEELGRASRDE
jgi:hypothetical protein